MYERITRFEKVTNDNNAKLWAKLTELEDRVTSQTNYKTLDTMGSKIDDVKATGQKYMTDFTTWMTKRETETKNSNSILCIALEKLEQTTEQKCDRETIQEIVDTTIEKVSNSHTFRRNVDTNQVQTVVNVTEKRVTSSMIMKQNLGRSYVHYAINTMVSKMNTSVTRNKDSNARVLKELSDIEIMEMKNAAQKNTDNMKNATESAILKITNTTQTQSAHYQSGKIEDDITSKMCKLLPTSAGNVNTNQTAQQETNDDQQTNYENDTNKKADWPQLKLNTGHKIPWTRKHEK